MDSGASEGTNSTHISSDTVHKRSMALVMADSAVLDDCDEDKEAAIAAVDIVEVRNGRNEYTATGLNDVDEFWAQRC